MSKRKSPADRRKEPLSLELDEEQLAVLELLPELLHPSLNCLRPVLDSIGKAYSDVVPPPTRALPIRQATDFKRTTAAAKILGIDYREDDLSYIFNLKAEHSQDSMGLYEHFASVIKDLKSSDYVSARNDESFCRTILDLLIIDRLSHLKDKDANRRLQVSAEVPMSIQVQDVFGNKEIIRGRADWALGYGSNKLDTGAILLVVEAKPYESAAIGMPQLLVYMAAVHEARKDRVNKSVFGMLSDCRDFRFAFLDEDKKLFVTESFAWVTKQSTIIAYLDMVLINAIESSPHTTPQKENNRTILNYTGFLERQWNFGTQSDDEETEDRKEDDYEMVDIVSIGGRVVLRTLASHGSPSAPG